jgi:hypothetical protein
VYSGAAHLHDACLPVSSLPLPAIFRRTHLIVFNAPAAQHCPTLPNPLLVYGRTALTSYAVDIKQYERCLGWGKKRWGWELMCRSGEYHFFGAFYGDAPKAERQAAAGRFGLRDFVDPNMPPEQVKAAQPRFSDRMVGFISNLSGASPLVKEMKISPGEVLIRVNLRDALRNEAVLREKLRVIEIGLTKRLSELGHPRTRRVKGGVLELIANIITVDCIRQGMTHGATAKIVWPKEFGDRAESLAGAAARSRIEKAHSYVEKEYRKVLVWDTKEFEASRKDAKARFGERFSTTRMPPHRSAAAHVEQAGRRGHA